MATDNDRKHKDEGTYSSGVVLVLKNFEISCKGVNANSDGYSSLVRRVICPKRIGLGLASNFGICTTLISDK